MKLINILLEADGKPKAIIMAGGGGAGKTYILNQLGITNLPIINPDKFVEDPESPAYNNLSKATALVNKQAAEFTTDGKSFVWDTTASNPKKVEELVDKGYDVYMVMVYTHPMISYIANFTARDRNIPGSAVFSTWRNVYDLIDRYNQILNGNLSIFVNDRGGKYDKEVQAFNKAAEKGVEGIKDYLKTYNKENEIGGSSFRKPVEIPLDQEELFNTSTQNIEWDRGNYSEDRVVKALFIKQFEKTGKAPDQAAYEKALASYKTKKENDRVREDKVLTDIANMVFDKDFQDKLKHSTPEEIKDNINTFLK